MKKHFIETELVLLKDYKTIVGTDEVGRGALAGPISAGCCWISPEIFYKHKEAFKKLDDSKKLTLGQREAVFEEAQEFEKQGLVKYTYCELKADWINRWGLGVTNREVIRFAIGEWILTYDRPDLIIVDFLKMPNVSIKQLNVPKADATYASVALASVIAKVTRDRYMKGLASQFPQYGWDTNVGYRSRKHIGALREYGVTPFHRTKFIDVKRVIEAKNQTRLEI
jgi:ribonuclease HII